MRADNKTRTRLFVDGVEGFRAAAAYPERVPRVLSALTNQLRTLDDHRIFALGECAQHRGQVYGLVAPLWDQAKVLADYLTKRIAAESAVVIAPAVPYHFYPAFLEYPGSVSIGLETASGVTSDIARSIARHGPHRFYVLNTGISTVATPLLVSGPITIRSATTIERFCSARVCAARASGFR